MKKLSNNSLILVNVSGPDAPGITSALTGILAQANATIVDIGQAVIHGLLSLSIVYETESASNSSQTLLKDLLFKATEMGLKLEFKLLTSPSKPILESGTFRYAITLIAQKISAAALHQVTQILANYQLNIDEIQRLSEGNFGCVELIVSTHKKLDKSLDQRKLKKDLLAIAKDCGVDIALQAEGLYRRAKRMVVFDMDSTLIQNEVIDELAREHGVYDQVSALTEEAMRGNLDFNESLNRRCAHLKGLTLEQVEKVFDRIQITHGAQDLIKVLKKLGYKIALISGGFTLIADRLKTRLGIDYAYANQLEIKDGALTGKVHPPIVNAQRKADLLDVIAQQEQILLDQVIAIGDGANDLLMLEKAGLGIAFNAKPLVCEQADLAISQKNLSSVLYLLGISGRDLSDIL